MSNFAVAALTGDTTSTAIDYTQLVTDAIDWAFKIGTQAINWSLENPILALCFVCGTVLPIGFAVFSMAKGATKG